MLVGAVVPPLDISLDHRKAIPSHRELQQYQDVLVPVPVRVWLMPVAVDVLLLGTFLAADRSTLHQSWGERFRDALVPAPARRLSVPVYTSAPPLGISLYRDRAIPSCQKYWRWQDALDPIAVRVWLMLVAIVAP